MREKPRDINRLQHIIQAIDNIEEFKKGLTLDDLAKNKLVFFAIVKNVEIIGEASYMLSKDFKKSHDEIYWKDIEGMRHVLVHDYYQIKTNRVWDTITTDLASLRSHVEKYIDELARQETVIKKSNDICQNLDSLMDSEIETIKDKLESQQEDQEESNTKSVRRRR